MSAIALMSTDNIAVVQNDEFTTNLKTINQPDTVTITLADLEAERITWETGAYRTSNQALYAVLAKCLSIAQADTAELAKQRNAALEAFYKQRGYSYKEDSPPATRVVKAVFGGVDRRRFSTYSLVLREAIKEGISPSNLADWIEQKGGIQEIRLSQSKTFIKPSLKVAIARQSFNSRPELATVNSEAMSLLADANHLGARCVLIAEQSANGSFVVRGFTRADGALNAAFAALYSEQKKAA